MNARILLVEDEEHLQHVIKMNLELEGYEVVTTNNGKQALKIFDEQRFNMLILDVMLPEMDGFTLCEQIRLRNHEVPILFLTAKDSYKNKIEGLKKGADDYITKPFNLEEFLLRVGVLVKHSLKGTEEAKDLMRYEFGENEIDFVSYKAKCKEGTVDLSKKEVDILRLLIERKGQVVSRNEILQFVWGYDVFPSTRTIDNFILNFRKLFEQNPKNPVYFLSVRGVGYKFGGENE